MKIRIFTPLLISLPFFLFVSCQTETKKSETTEEVEVEEVTTEKVAVAVLSAKNNSGLSGEVTFIEKDGKVRMQALVENVSEGEHAIHIHAVGDCSADDGTSAGGHWNPTEHDHGKWEEEHFHKGDIGNLIVGSSGKGQIELETELWCIDCDDQTKNIVGKSIIVHAKADDFKSQPSGAAGARIGCGVIEVKK
ncbi:superoxide dismutase family protein [Sediminitomix flava]|uniref:Cu-Zn family superoxide dismutase n=1 Tax=Sediminitomix flava TaxID=379075 RepID=A0A315ZCI9_SEDFL|nr:superoxide dismutase family protein [Sediminitomix flava]PWJ42813.1 Cu-Zn family superoxide dismutase [Sediminitomix flava]